MNNDANDLILQCNSEIESSTNVKKRLEAINTIVQIKSTLNKQLHYNDLYRDVKKLIIFYLEAIDERKYEYDFLNNEYLLKILNIFQEHERVALLDFLIRKLKIHGLENHVGFFIFQKRKNEIKILWARFPKSAIQLISKVITYNLLSIVLTIVFAYIIYFVVLLPSFTGIVLFDIKYKHLSNHFLINHFANSLLAIFGMNSDDFAKPINTTGTILAVLGKLVFILLILKICIDKFIEIFKSTF